MLSGKRSVRVGDKILREVAVLLLERVKDPRVRGVTVTGIRLSDDLKVGRIYYSVMGPKDQITRAQAGLDSATGFIKRQIGSRMGLRYVPEIIFDYDPTMEQGSQMERLFEEIRASESEQSNERNEHE
jgi:ribosome-binding factor A